MRKKRFGLRNVVLLAGGQSGHLLGRVRCCFRRYLMVSTGFCNAMQMLFDGNHLTKTYVVFTTCSLKTSENIWLCYRKVGTRLN